MDRLTDVPGASRVVRGGLVAYADGPKRSVLDVSEGLLRVHGAVSAPVARAMAQAVRRRFDADVGVATTGIAGPTGATALKPLGLSFVAASDARATRVDERRHVGSREDVKSAAVQQALDLLAVWVRDEGIL